MATAESGRTTAQTTTETTDAAPERTTISRAAFELDTSLKHQKEVDFTEFIERVIIAQPDGKRAMNRAFRRMLARVRQEATGRKPKKNRGVLGTYFFAGPTTCGKDEIIHRLAEFVHDDRDAVLFVDVSQFMQKFQLSRLTGASPNMVGYKHKDKDYKPPAADEKDEYAELSQHNLDWSRKSSTCPITIIVFDEADKGCREFYHILLRIIREGKLTLGDGSEVDFSNCILFFTSNEGSSEVEAESNKKGIGFRTDVNGKTQLSKKKIEEIIMERLRVNAPPEFRARIEEKGEFVIFDALTDDQLDEICILKVNEFAAEMLELEELTVDIDEPARHWVRAKAESVAELSGALQTHVEDELQNQLNCGIVNPGDTIAVSVITRNVDGEETEADDQETEEVLWFYCTQAPFEVVTDPVQVEEVLAHGQELLDEMYGGSDDDREDEEEGDEPLSLSTALVPFSSRARQPFEVRFGADNYAELKQMLDAVTHVFMTGNEFELVSSLTGVKQGQCILIVRADLDSMVALRKELSWLSVRTKNVDLV